MFDIWIEEAFSVVRKYFTYAGITFFVFYVVLRKPLWFRRIQKKLPKLTDYGRDIFYSLISVSIFATVAVICFTILAPYANFFMEADHYGWWYYGFTWIWMLFIHDTYFYWMHRAMHHKLLFKHVHKIHHKSTNPSPWTAYAFHPLEGFLEAMIIPILVFGLPVHKASISTFFIFQIAYNVYGHLGFELYPKNFHKTWIGKYVNTSVAHNLHHKRFNGNYGLYFLYWDRWMGTLRKDYDTTFELTTGSTIRGTEKATHQREMEVSVE